MKITTKTTITIIEATAEDLRQSNDLGNAFCRILRNSLNGSIVEEEGEEAE